MHTNVYSMIEDCYKTSILLAALNLWTADGSPMSSMGKASLYLQIVDFKFSHTFILCDIPLETDFLFGVDLQKWYSSFYCWDPERHLFIKKGRLFPDIHNIALVKSTLKIPPRHNGAVPIKIKGHDLQDQVAYFISNQHTKKEVDPNIHIQDSIYNIKGKINAICDGC